MKEKENKDISKENYRMKEQRTKQSTNEREKENL